MAIIFIKKTNGNVLLDNNGNEYSLPPQAIVQKHPNSADEVIIWEQGFSKFYIDYNDVTTPVVVSRDA